MSTYKVLRRPLRVDGVLRNPGDVFTADLPRAESWIRAGMLVEVEPPKPPPVKRSKSKPKAAAAPQPVVEEESGGSDAESE